MDQQMPPGIDTELFGCKFRSRLEAKWALYFTALGMEWEYEPLPVPLADGSSYLPDFIIYGVEIASPSKRRKKIDLWVEVKGHMDPDSMRKVRLFSQQAPIIVLMDVSKLNEHRANEDGRDWWRRMHDAYSKWPYPYSFRYIDKRTYGAFLGVTWDGRPCLFSSDNAYRADAHHGAMSLAIRAAAHARFDHGNDPTTSMPYVNACAMVEEAKRQRGR